MPYKVKIAHDQALIDLVDIAPQPRSAGLRYTRETVSASGIVYREAPYVELEWSVIGNVTDYQALLAQFDLDSLTSANVTVYVRNEIYGFARYNGRAIRPAPGRSVDWAMFPRGITIVVKDLVAL